MSKRHKISSQLEGPTLHKPFYERLKFFRLVMIKTFFALDYVVKIISICIMSTKALSREFCRLYRCRALLFAAVSSDQTARTPYHDSRLHASGQSCHREQCENIIIIFWFLFSLAKAILMEIIS